MTSSATFSRQTLLKRIRGDRLADVHLDLNLLTALDALLEEGSVAGAAQRLHVTAPAMSRTLGRIRHATKDQILVRTGREMVPTPYALGVQEEVHRLVQQAHAVLAPERDVDLETLERVFTVQWHDAITAAIGPALVAGVRSLAPGVRFRFLPESSVDTTDLRHGRVDLEIGADEPAQPEISWELMGRDRLVVAMRPAHPYANGRLTLHRYAKAAHVTVSRRGRLRDPIDGALDEHGLRRTVVASAPTSIAALCFARDADILVAAPERMTAVTVASLGLVTKPMPVELPLSRVIVAWHQRYDGDRAHAWLRARVREGLTAVLGDTG
jgi:DNA-binding transcriptional LysR family regulator